jgi:branched-subunit amino acid ABC-type transport system permease component
MRFSILIDSFGFGLVTASIIGLGAVGVTLQYGVTNYINFANGSYMVLAAFLTWVWNVHFGINFWVAALMSAVLLAFASVIINRVLLQPFAKRNLPVVYMFIVTLALWLIMGNGIFAIWGPDTRQFRVGIESPIHIGPFLFTVAQLLIIAVAVAALSGLHLVLTRTRFGKAMRAMSDDPGLAQISGINTDRVVDATWLVSGFLIGLAGSALALNLTSFDPGFGDSYLFVIFAAVILGGIGQPYGTMLGALIIGLGTEMSAAIINPAYKADVAFLLLIVMIMVRPQGLIPAHGRV